MTDLRLLSGASALAILTLAADVPGQAPRQFTATSDLVRVDVSVLDHKRQPVRKLTAADFTVLEDGKPQKVAAFAEIDLPDPEVAPTPWMRDIAPDVRRNDDLSEHRLTVLLMDDATMPTEVQMVESAKSIARSIVDRLGPRDLLAVVFTRDNRATQNFTRDRARLHRAIDAFHPSGHDPRGLLRPAPEPMVEMGYFYSSLGALREVIDVLAAIPERRKSLVYVSTGVPISPEQARSPSSPHADLYGTFKDLFRRADRASVNIYVADPGGLGGLRFLLEREANRGQRVESLQILQQRINDMTADYRDYLKSIADNTGGYAFMNTNEFDSRVAQMFRETASFYLLGYATENTRADGRFRRIQVRVNRNDVTIRSRQGYYGAEPRSAKPIVAPPATVAAIAGLLPKSDLPLSVTATPLAVAGRRDATVAVQIGLIAPPAAGATDTRDDLEVLVNAYTPEGDRRASEQLKGTVALDRLGGSAGAYEFLSQLVLAPGRYELRVSVASAMQARSGSVYVDVEVPDFQRSALSMSGVLLAATPPTPVAPRDLLVSLVPIVPTVRRTFASADRVTTFVTIHQGGSGTLEPAVATFRITDSTGKVVVEQPRRYLAADFGASRSVAFEVDVPVARLAAGQYLLTIDTAAGKATVRRDVRFEIH